MPSGAVAAIGGVASIGSSILGGKATKKAAGKAASAEMQAAELGIEEQRRQFDRMQELLAPFVKAGESSLSSQMALLGLGGPEAEQAAIQRIQQGPAFTEMVRQGEEAILQRASATGGLRGGNVQAALAQFRPSILNQLIEQQYGRLAGLTQLGQASAAGVGAAGLQTGQNIAGLLSQKGQAAAQSALISGQAQRQLYGDIAETIGAVAPYFGGKRTSAQQDYLGGVTQRKTIL